MGSSAILVTTGGQKQECQLAAQLLIEAKRRYYCIYVDHIFGLSRIWFRHFRSRAGGQDCRLAVRLLLRLTNALARKFTASQRPMTFLI